jgi:arylsulfatase A-like enzyme
MSLKILSCKVIIPLLLLTFVGFSCEKDQPAPNIILILSDDMGFSDPGCYGGEIETPNLDLLAENGIRFTQMYNCARCCPTRASLMTGKYQHRVGMAKNGRNLDLYTPTIAEILAENGYHTGMAGKWHLSLTQAVEPKEEQLKWMAHQADYGKFAPLETYPCNRGFDEHWGVIWGVVNYFDPFSLVHNENPIREVPDDFYMTEFITDKSLEMIEQFTEDEDPFFLYVAHTAPHWPLHALPEDIDKYKDTYSDGWEKLSKERYNRLIDMGLIDAERYTLPENTSGKSWEECTQKEKEANHMATHAAMVDRMDQGIGKIIRKLKERVNLIIRLSSFLLITVPPMNGAILLGLTAPGIPVTVRRSIIILSGLAVNLHGDTWVMPGPAHRIHHGGTGKRNPSKGVSILHLLPTGLMDSKGKRIP